MIHYTLWHILYTAHPPAFEDNHNIYIYIDRTDRWYTCTSMCAGITIFHSAWIIGTVYSVSAHISHRYTFIFQQQLNCWSATEAISMNALIKPLKVMQISPFPLYVLEQVGKSCHEVVQEEQTGRRLFHLRNIWHTFARWWNDSVHVHIPMSWSFRGC